MTKDLDANNFLKNGLVNVKVDPDKMNAMLANLPIKVVDGKISEVRLCYDTKNSKAEIVMGKVELIAYIDDHSQFRTNLNAGGNFVVAKVLSRKPRLSELLQN